LDRNLRLKARVRGILAADEKQIISLVDSFSRPPEHHSQQAPRGQRNVSGQASKTLISWSAGLSSPHSHPFTLESFSLSLESWQNHRHILRWRTRQPKLANRERRRETERKMETKKGTKGFFQVGLLTRFSSTPHHAGEPPTQFNPAFLERNKPVLVPAGWTRWWSFFLVVVLKQGWDLSFSLSMAGRD